MERFRLTLTALTALLLFGCGLPLSAETLKGEVVSVADGDTLTIQTKTGQREKVRLYGIDAPERNQAYGEESFRLLHLLLFHKKVTIQTEDRDDYNRVLGVVFHKGTNINIEMVKRGAAWHYKHYAPDSTELAEAETAARKAKLGLWKTGNPTAPWDFRHGVKTQPVTELAEAETAARKAKLGLWKTGNPTAPWDFRHGVKTQPVTEPVHVAESGVLQGICSRVTDGDTLTIRLSDGREEKVQLFGIDAPERDQEHGNEATAALSSLVLNKKIRVTYPGREDLGRINGKVYVDDQYVNLILVKEGHAWHSDKYGPNEDDLRAAQQEARSAGKGLWADSHPLEPWRFRNGHY